MSENNKAEPAELPAPPEPTPPADPGPTPTPARGGGRLLAVFAVVLALAAGGAAFYLWQQLEQTRSHAAQAQQSLAEQLAAVENTSSRQAEELERALRNTDEAFRQRQALRAAIDNLRDRLARDRSDWMLAEVDYLLTIANRRLRFEQDIAAALAALQEADQRLQLINDPALTPVREAIASEVEALRAVPAVDRSGLALQLGALIRGADTLPVDSSIAAPGEVPAAPAAERPPVSDWRGFLAALWSDIKGLVTIRRGEEAAPPLLPPEQRYFLHRNLALKLESARLALLQRQPAVYGDALGEARDWVSQYFDTESAQGQAYLASLERLAKAEIAPAPPDISGSLRQLRRVVRALATQPEPQQ